jgi:uncharacterized protein DUF2834
VLTTRVATTPHLAATIASIRKASRFGTQLGVAGRREDSHMSNKTRIALGAVLFAFADLNAYVVWKYGYVGFLQLVMANAATIAAVVDMTIALSLVAVWLFRDAKARGISPLPYLALTATLGSIGPLLYLIVHGRRPALQRA